MLLTKKSSSASQVLTDVDSTTSSCKFASKLADIDVSLSGVNLDSILPMSLKNSWEMQKGIYRFFILQKFMCAYNLFYSNICIYVTSICIYKPDFKLYGFCSQMWVSESGGPQNYSLFPPPKDAPFVTWAPEFTCG